MKKKIFILLMTAMIIFSFTACGGASQTTSEQETESTPLAQTVETDTNVEEADTEEADAEEADESVQPAETASSTENIELEVVDPMLQSFLSWSGMQYIYDKAQYDTLTTEAALSMAAFAIVSNQDYDEAWYDEQTGGYALSDSIVSEYTNNYFGKAYDISSFQNTGEYSMVSLTENGDLLIQVGDWGMAAPAFEVQDVTENADGSYTVSVDYSFYDYELQENSEVLADAVYTFMPNADSTFGYVITDMQFTSY